MGQAEFEVGARLELALMGLDLLVLLVGVFWVGFEGLKTEGTKLHDQASVLTPDDFFKIVSKVCKYPLGTCNNLR